MYLHAYCDNCEEHTPVGQVSSEEPIFVQQAVTNNGLIEMRTVLAEAGLVPLEQIAEILEAKRWVADERGIWCFDCRDNARRGR